MAIYTAMVLVYRADLKIAIPTAVSSAALASVEGAALHVFYLRDIAPGTFHDWLAAGPIVIFGAPAGAFLMTLVPRIRVLYAVSAICLLQFVWTLNRTAQDRAVCPLSCEAVLPVHEDSAGIAGLMRASVEGSGLPRSTVA